MKYAIISTFNFKGQDVRVAFDDDAYIFLEDAERLHHLLSEKSLIDLINPKDIFTIIATEKGKAPQEQKVFPFYKMEGYIGNPPDIAAESYDKFQIFIWGVEMATIHLKNLISNQFVDLKDPATRDEMLEKAYRSQFSAQVDVISADFFIDFWSRPLEEVITFEYLEPGAIPASRWSCVNGGIRMEATNETPIA